MTRFNTMGLVNQEPPAAISFFTPGPPAHWPLNYNLAVTNAPSGASLSEQRIRSAFESADRELDRYKRYLPRWDGYHGLPFSQEVLCNAAWVLGYSMESFFDTGIAPQLVTTGPASDGSLDVEFQVAEKRLLMTLYPREQQVRLCRFEGDAVLEHEAPLGEQTLDESLGWLNQPSVVQHSLDQD